MKVRYEQVWQQPYIHAEIKQVSSLIIDEAALNQRHIQQVPNKYKLKYRDQKIHWQTLDATFKNGTYTMMYEVDTDKMGIISIDNQLDVEGEFEYHSRITLAQVPLNSYYTVPARSKSFFNRQSELDRQMLICWQRSVPGSIILTSLDKHDKSKLAVVYRYLTEEGAIHRVRILKLSCEDSPEVKDFGLEGSFTVSSIAMFNNTIIYSRFFDHYQQPKNI